MAVVEYVASGYDKVVWEEDEPELVFYRVRGQLADISKIKADSAEHEILTDHQLWTAITSIFFSNKIEGKGVALSETANLCRDILVHGSSSSSSSCPVSDISSSRQRDRREAVQHAAAFHSLQQTLVTKKEQLSISTIKEAHLILMADAVREDGLIVQAGNSRTGAANAGYFKFAPPSSIASNMHWLVREYNERVASRNYDPFQLAAWLSFEFVCIHPFDDGNGRMCRMLLNMCLMSNGIPFPVALGFSSGHKQGKKHYMQCLRHADTTKHARRLAFVALCAFRDIANNFFKLVEMASRS